MGFIESSIMGENVKSDHFKLLENVDQDVKYIAVKGLAQPGPEIGKSSFTRDTVYKSRTVSFSPPK